MTIHPSSICSLFGAAFALFATHPTRALAFTPPRMGTISTIYHGKHSLTLASSLGIEPVAAADTDDQDSTNPNFKTTVDGGDQPGKKRRLAVLLCPAQFCVPKDYAALLDTIKGQTKNVVAARVAPLPRTEWIKVAKQLPTKNFLDANLSVRVTLDWYFEAMEQALAELFAVGGEDVEVCVIGHSIGGWVARAYLGGLSG